MKKLFGIFYAVVLITMLVPLYGQQRLREIKTKVISGEAHWSGDILIKGDVVVAPSGHLQIAPGTHIRFAPNTDVHHFGFDKTRAELIIKGTIVCKGSINQKIVFTSAAENPRMQDWAGIVIMNGNKPAVFEFAIIEYAYNGFDIKKSNPVIQNCQIQFNYNAGLKIAVRSQAKLIGNIIRDNGYAGIICETGARPILTDNLITKNQIGIIAFGSANPNLGNLNKGAEFNPGRNALFDNQEYDFYNHSVHDIKAEGNSWGSKELKQILTQIYDKEDAERFGAVDFNPIIGNVDLMKKMLLAQQPAPAPQMPQNSTPAETSVTAPQKAITPSTAKEKILPSPSAPPENVTLMDTVKKIKEEKNLVALKPKAEETTTVENFPPPKTVAQESAKTQEEQPIPKINYNQIFLDVFLDQKVKVRKKTNPVVSDPAKGMYEHGKVVVRVVVDRQGNVEEAKILKGINYYYDQLALEAAKKFKFAPGKVKGVPVRFSTSILFMF